MEIFIDLKGLTTKQEVLRKLGEVFEFGGPGPEANVPVVGPLDGKGWGMNWDALNDSLRHLEKGGIWDTSKKFVFPLYIKIYNYEEYQKADPEGFKILTDIFETAKNEYAKQKKFFSILFADIVVCGDFTQLERDIFQWYKKHYKNEALNKQIDSAKFVRRWWTKVGYYVDFEVDKNLPKISIEDSKINSWPIQGPLIESPQVEHGGDVILWSNRNDPGHINTIEMFCYGNRFDKELVTYELYEKEEPGPLAL